MSVLVDTNVVSELRKGDRCDPGVARWYAGLPDDGIYTSVLVVGEVRRGVESIRRRDPSAAQALDRWLLGLLEDFADRILPVDLEVTDLWGRLNVPDPLPAVDGLLAATAMVHGLVLATRNVADVARCGVATVNPFETGPDACR